MSRLASVARGGFFASPPRVIDLIARWLVVTPASGPHRPVLLDPCAGEGEAIARLAGALDGVAHAIEVNETRAVVCRQQVPSTLCADALEAIADDGAYSGLWLNPPYDTDRADEHGRLEGLFLSHYLPALAPDGILIFIIRRQLVVAFAARLSTHCARLRVLPFPPPEAATFDQVVVLGVKKRLPQAEPAAMAALLRAAHDANAPSLIAGPARAERYPLPPLREPSPPRPAANQPADRLLVMARRHGSWALAEVADRLRPPTDARLTTPAMPLRFTHLAMLLVAGYFDHTVVTTADGQRLLVRGRAVKQYVEIERNEETGATTEREVIRTELAILDLATGRVTTIDSSTAEGARALGAFLEEHQEALAERVRADYQPLYTAARRPEFAPLLARLKRSPLGAQSDVIGALTLSLERHGVACAASAPGTGKTFMAGAVSYILWQRAGGHGIFRVVISAPPHLIEKWKRELELTVPGVRATIIESVTDLDRAMADQTPGLQCLILARTTGKLDSFKRPALGRRLAVTAETGRTWVPCCPSCREPVTVSEATIVDTRRRCERCGAILYQARAAPPKVGRGGFRWVDGGPIAGQPQDGPRRYPLARRLKQRYTGQIDLYISDEYHESKGGATAAGMADGTLAAAARRTLLLSGTISSGKASGSFYLLFRFVAAVRQEFRYGDATRWVDRYGIWQRRWKPDPNDRVRYGASSQRKILAGAPQEKPGILPAMVRHLLDHTAFLRLEDVATGLPPYTETVELVDLDDTAIDPGQPGLSQASAYHRLEAELTAIVRQHLAAGGTKLLGAYLQSLLTYPDNCTNGDVVRHPDDGREVARAPALPAAVWYPKEVALRELALRERRRGRRLLVYVSHTERRDLTPRLRQLLEGVGLRVAVLKQRDAAPRQREAWLQRQNAAGIDVLMTNPGLVKTGLDLVEYASIVFTEVDYSIFTLRQASKRSWRVGQSRPVEVTYLAYRGTMQATALSLVARKLRSALHLEGDTVEAGLAATDADDDSLLAMLARALRTGQPLDDVEHLFADLRRAEAEQRQELVAISGPPVPDPPLVWPPGADGASAPPESPATATPASPSDASAPPAPTPVVATWLVLGSLADLTSRGVKVGRGAARSNHEPPGQLSFADLLDPQRSPPPVPVAAKAEEPPTGETRQLPLWAS